MMEEIRQAVLRHSPPKNYPLRPGDTVKVHIKVKEGDKERIQIFEGVVLKIQGRDISRSFTVRKISQGIGVEKTFPFAAPHIVKAEITGRAKVRRARLFYLRNRKGRAARLLSARFSAPAADDGAGASSNDASAEAAAPSAAASAEAAAAASSSSNKEGTQRKPGAEKEKPSASAKAANPSPTGKAPQK